MIFAELDDLFILSRAEIRLRGFEKQLFIRLRGTDFRVAQYLFDVTQIVRDVKQARLFEIQRAVGGSQSQRFLDEFQCAFIVGLGGIQAGEAAQHGGVVRRELLRNVQTDVGGLKIACRNKGFGLFEHAARFVAQRGHAQQGKCENQRENAFHGDTSVI